MKRVHGFYWYIKKDDESWYTRYYCIRSEGPRPSARVRATMDVAHWRRCGRFAVAKTKCSACAYVGQGDNSYFRIPPLPDDSFPTYVGKRSRSGPLRAPANDVAETAPAAVPAEDQTAPNAPPVDAPQPNIEGVWTALLHSHQDAQRREEEARRQLTLATLRAEEEWRGIEASKRAEFEAALALDKQEHAWGFAREALELMAAAEAETSSIAERARSVLMGL